MALWIPMRSRWWRGSLIGWRSIAKAFSEPVPGRFSARGRDRRSAPLRAQGFNEGKGKPVTAEDVRFTTREDALYIIELGVPTGELRVQSLGKAARLLDRPIESIALLGSDEKLQWKQGDDALSIAAPHAAPSPEALVYKMTLKS